VQRNYDTHIAGVAVADRRLSHKHQKTDTCPDGLQYLRKAVRDRARSPVNKDRTGDNPNR
jgi:hypothetical protein